MDVIGSVIARASNACCAVLLAAHGRIFAHRAAVGAGAAALCRASYKRIYFII